MELWDTIEQDYYFRRPTLKTLGASGFFVVFDISNEQSFQYIKEHANSIKEITNMTKIMLIGIDQGKENLITFAEVAALAAEFRTEYKIVSLSNVTSTENIFESMASSIINSLFPPTQNEKETNNDDGDSSRKNCLVM
jgi:GTPase SAR1 family protein